MIVRLVLTLGLAALGFGASATIPVNQASTYTTAVAEGVADIHSDSAVLNSNPIVTSSEVVGITDFASGSGIVAPGLMSTSAEAQSVSGFASGVGTADYIESFSGASHALLHIDFSSSSFGDPLTFSGATLFIQVTDGGTVVLSQAFDSSASTNFDLSLDYDVLLSGGNEAISFSLASEADTLTGGDAFNSALLSFTTILVPVPEPGSMVMMLVGLLVLLTSSATHRARQR